MAKQSAAQKDIMQDVMHEYKEGELKTSAGKKVKDRDQAIAIGLHKAGASKYESKADNKRNLKRSIAKKES
jgi:hypothetical protein